MRSSTLSLMIIFFMINQRSTYKVNVSQKYEYIVNKYIYLLRCKGKI